MSSAWVNLVDVTTDVYSTQPSRNHQHAATSWLRGRHQCMAVPLWARRGHRFPHQCMAVPLWSRRGQYMSLCQISSKSVIRLQRYGHFTVFRMADVRHLGFVKFEFFNGQAVKGPILHQRTRFRKDWSNRCGDVSIFVIFNMAPPPCWIFKKIVILQTIPCRWPIYVTMPNFIKIGHTVAEIWRFYGF